MTSTSPRFFIFFICLVIHSFPASANLINGNFSNNVNNWTISNFGGGDPADFYNVENNGSDPYLKINSRLFANGLKTLSFTQDIAVSSANALFSVDIKVFSPTVDMSGSGTNQFLGDAVLFTAQSSSLGQHGLGLIYENNRFFGSTMSNSLDTISSQSGFFDLHLQADLSAFIGQTTTIGFSLLPDDDFKSFSYGIDNIQLSSIPITVPIPTAMPLFILGLTLLFGSFKRRFRLS